ncbi:DUF2442 domain-containing protein [Prosthecobacter sp. SYSU 5D2]|uniref:DUF2442 domain-containing protein n=1 Tax=Prosthecobacter sp. SYSU 5D2 TaxID=3134134 RepID=UPI0031FE7D47
MAVSFGRGIFKVRLSNGRTVVVPTALFPRLEFATRAERQQFEVIGNGTGIHWPALDEDISISGLLQGRGSAESPKSILQWIMARRDKFSPADQKTPAIRIIRTVAHTSSAKKPSAQKLPKVSNSRSRQQTRLVHSQTSK